METIIVAFVAIVVGAAVLLFGYKLFRILLPILGFIIGVVAGIEFIDLLLGTGFFRDVLGIVVGVFFGLVLAVIAYFWWYIGVIIAIAGMGYAIGYSILPAFGIDDLEFVSFLIGAVAAVAFAVSAVVLGLPPLIVIVLSSLWGAGAVLAGILLLLGDIQLEGIGHGAVQAVVGVSLLWLIVWLVLAIVGMAFQMATRGDYVLEYTYGSDSTAQPPPPPTSAG